MPRSCKNVVNLKNFYLGFRVVELTFGYVGPSNQLLFTDVSLRKQNETDAEDGEKKQREEEKENESDSEDEDDLVNPDEDVNELLRRAASSYEYRVKYYEELIHETVTEFERGMKRAHVDELSILINEATDETKQMQNVCHTIMRSLGKLIPIIYQSIEILEYQVKADTGSFRKHLSFQSSKFPKIGLVKRDLTVET